MSVRKKIFNIPSPLWFIIPSSVSSLARDRFLIPQKFGLSHYLTLIVFSAIGLFIGYTILKILYAANGGDEGEYFLDRLLALAWVANMRYCVVLVPTMILSFILNRTAPSFGLFLGILLYGMAIGSVVYTVILIRDSLREIVAAPRVEPKAPTGSY